MSKLTTSHSSRISLFPWETPSSCTQSKGTQKGGDCLCVHHCQDSPPTPSCYPRLQQAQAEGHRGRAAPVWLGSIEAEATADVASLAQLYGQK